MIKLLVYLIGLTAVLSQVDPPVWPEAFTQASVETSHVDGSRVNILLHYDSKHDMERIDFSVGTNDVLCDTLLPGVTTPCIHLVRQKRRWIQYPEKKLCCMCCDENHGCGVLDRNWLQDFIFEGEQSIDGQSFYKWSIKYIMQTDYYYATKTDQRIPRRLVNNDSKKTQDFILSSYNTDPIPTSVFSMPSYCKEDCPSTTICQWLRTGKMKSTILPFHSSKNKKRSTIDKSNNQLVQ